MSTNAPGDPRVDAGTPAPRIAPTRAEAAGAPPAFPADAVRAAKLERRLRIGVEALPTRVPWGAVGLFLAVAFSAGWAVCLPFWFAGGLEAVDPVMFQLLLMLLMFTPTLATLVVVLVTRPKRPATMLGLRVRPIGRTLLMSAIAWFAPPILLALGVFLAAALGFVTVDLTFQNFQRVYLSNMAELGIGAETVAQVAELPVGALIAMVVGQTLTIGVVTSSLAAFGEELGWRGWLLPALRPLGTWPAILISCVVWGLWHAPIVLLGYNFNDRGPLGLLLMVGFCVSIGLFVSWLRLRGGTVYPAAIAHGSINATAAATAVLFIGDIAAVDPKVALVGWTPWVPFLVLAAVLALIGQFRKQPLPGLTLAESAIALERAGERPEQHGWAAQGAADPAVDSSREPW